MGLDSKYHVGDKVVVNNVKHCTFGWSEFMKEFHGRLVTIQSVSWNKNKGVYRYRLEEDGGDWSWDDSCFEFEVIDLSEFDTSDANIFDLLS